MNRNNGLTQCHQIKLNEPLTYQKLLSYGLREKGVIDQLAIHVWSLITNMLKNNKVFDNHEWETQMTALQNKDLSKAEMNTEYQLKGVAACMKKKFGGSFIVSGSEHNQEHQLTVDAFQDLKKNSRYALASDIDGTLFFHDINGYKAGDIKAIQKFQKSGHLFGVCTGRPLCHFDSIRQLNLDFYIVTSGAVLLDKNFQIIEEHPISKELTRKVFNEYKDKAGVIVQTGSYNRFYATFEEIKSDDLYLVKDFEDIQEDKIYGISIVVDNDETASLIKKELDNKYPELEGFQNKNSIDIVKKGCSKGVATRKMKQLLKANVMAGIGDSYNDIPLITSSDIGFTFYNSPKEVQDKATYLVNDIEQAINRLMEDK